MAKQRLLYIAQEISPYLPSSPLADNSNTVAQDLQGKGYEVRSFMPKYSSINERRNQLHEVIRLSGLNLSIDDTDHPLIIKVATLLPTRMQVYFIDNDDYFQSQPDKGLETVAHPSDNDERMMFFTKGIIETVRKLRWAPAVIHCSGWLSALTPLYIRVLEQDDPILSPAKIIYALRRENFNGTLDARLKEKLKMCGFDDQSLTQIDTATDWMTLNRLAIDYADAIVEDDTDLPQELIDYALASGKPFLRHTPDAGKATAYAEFYANVPTPAK